MQKVKVRGRLQNSNTKGKPQKARERAKGKALTLKELDNLVEKLYEKRPMCWNFVSEGLKNQYVVTYSRNSQ